VIVRLWRSMGKQRRQAPLIRCAKIVLPRTRWMGRSGKSGTPLGHRLGQTGDAFQAVSRFGLRRATAPRRQTLARIAARRWRCPSIALSQRVKAQNHRPVLMPPAARFAEMLPHDIE